MAVLNQTRVATVDKLPLASASSVKGRSLMVITDSDKAPSSAGQAVRSQVLKIEHTNVLPLFGRFDDIEMLTMARNLYILCLSAASVHVDITSHFIKFCNFVVCDCDAGCVGVCIYVRYILKTEEMSAITAKSADVEDIWFIAQNTVLPSVNVSAVYRHPYGYSETFDFLEKRI